MTAYQLNFLEALGWAVLDSFWQMALIWLVYQLVTAAYKNMQAANKSALAATSLITGFVFFLISLFSNLLNGYTNSFLYQVILPDNNNMLSSVNGLLPYLSTAYLLLLFIPLYRFYRNYKYVTVIRTTGLEKPAYDWRLFTNKIAAHIGITKKVTLRLSSIIQSPLTVGFLKPIILLPVAAVNQLTPQQIESVILHELAHIRRFDFLVNLICRFIQTILYCNPFVSYFVREHETEREKAADKLVLQFEYNAHAYASALVTLQKLAIQQSQFAMAATGNKNELLQRVEWIMGMGKRNKLSLRAIVTPLLVIIFFVCVNSLLQLTPAKQNKFSLKPKTNNNLFVNVTFPESNLFDVNNIIATPVTDEVHNTDDAHASDEHEAAITNDDTELVIEEPVYGEAYNPLVHAVSNFTSVIPTLNPEQSEDVKKAIAASKKVMEDISWKEIEKDIADAFSTLEKDKIKEVYSQSIAQDKKWKKLEEQLTLSYEQLNWDKLKNTLEAEINAIRIDSVQKAYTKALTELNIAKKELVKAKEKGIPDTDITLGVIDQQRKVATRVLQAVDSVRKLRVIDL